MRRPARPVLIALAAPLIITSGCVKPFQGSHVELDLGGATDIPGDARPLEGQPPSDTHYELYVITTDPTDPTMVKGLAFKLIDFEVVPVIDQADPCFIEADEQAKFPGLHSTMIAAKTTEKFTAGGHTPTADEAGQIADAEARLANQSALQSQLKTVVSHQVTFKLPDGTMSTRKDLRTKLAALVPDPSMIDDTSNKTRLSVCRKFWAANPDFYTGSDKVYSLPLNGVYYGMVEGINPINSAPLGGADFEVPDTFKDFDSLAINWQFNDPTDPRAADHGNSPTGYHYMAGKPQDRNRRVINVPLQNVDNPAIAGNAAIIPAIDEDQVHF